MPLTIAVQRIWSGVAAAHTRAAIPPHIRNASDVKVADALKACGATRLSKQAQLADRKPAVWGEANSAVCNLATSSPRLMPSPRSAFTPIGGAKASVVNWCPVSGIRFARTAIYVNVPASNLDFIRKTGMLYKPKLVASGIRADLRLRDSSFPVPDGIRIVRDASMLTAEAMADVCESVGFTIRNVTAEEVLIRCWQQDHIYSDLAFAGDRLVGLVRVFSDGVRSSWLSEICVHPDWQRKGVGSALLASVRARFAHTALFTEAFAEYLDFFRPYIPAAEGWLGRSLKSVRQ